MKKLLFLPILFFAVQSFAQSNNNRQSELNNTINSVFSDPELNKPYPTTVNHNHFKDSLMKMVLGGKYNQILEICKTTGFNSMMVYKNSEISRPMTDEQRIETLEKFRKLLPDNISVKANVINEETLFGDFSRGETWNFINKDGKKSKMTVMFINGQITNFLFTL